MRYQLKIEVKFHIWTFSLFKFFFCLDNSKSNDKANFMIIPTKNIFLRL